MGLPNRGVGVGTCPRVGVRDCDEPVRLAGDHIWSGIGIRVHPFHRLVEAVICVGVPMRPAIYSYRDDVTARIEASGPEDAGKLVSNLTLERLKRRSEQLISSQPVLFLARFPRDAHHLGEMKRDRFLRRLRMSQVAKGNCLCKRKDGMVHRRTVDVRDTQPLPCGPILHSDTGINDWPFYGIG